VATEPIPITSDWLRLDLQAEVLGQSPDGLVEIEWSLHPDRFDWLPDGSVYDRNVRTTYPPEVAINMLRQAAEEMRGKGFYAPPVLPNAADFIVQRIGAIAAALDKPEELTSWTNPSAHLLAEMHGRQIAIAAISVDLVCSTRLQATNPDAYNVIVPLLSRELAEIVGRFGGIVINFTGDGLIAGFSQKSTIGCDTAFDAATAMVSIVYAAMNPELRDRGYPMIDIRVAADAGEAHVRTVGSANSRSQPDVIGLPLSVASKIQAVATPGEVWIGQTMWEHLHVSRQQLCEALQTPESWSFVNTVGRSYRIFGMPMKSQLRIRQ
jgi:class 3 adenylate cyclase